MIKNKYRTIEGQDTGHIRILDEKYNGVAVSIGKVSIDNSSNEETALGISTIAMALRHLKLSDESLQTQSAKTLQGGLDWLLPRIESGEYHTVSPIGFYFAKLWYFETMYPLVFVGSALNQIEQLLNNPTEASPPS